MRMQLRYASMGRFSVPRKNVRKTTSNFKAEVFGIGHRGLVMRPRRDVSSAGKGLVVSVCARHHKRPPAPTLLRREWGTIKFRDS